MKKKKTDKAKRKEQLRTAQQRRRKKLKNMNQKAINIYLDEQFLTTLNVLCDVHHITQTEAIICLINYAVSDGNDLSSNIFSKNRIKHLIKKKKVKKVTNPSYITTL